MSHKRHLNQISKRLSDDADSGPPEEKKSWMSFTILLTCQYHKQLKQRRLKRERKMTDFIIVNPREKGIEIPAELMLRRGVIVIYSCMHGISQQ